MEMEQCADLVEAKTKKKLLKLKHYLVGIKDKNIGFHEYIVVGLYGYISSWILWIYMGNFDKKNIDRI